MKTFNCGHCGGRHTTLEQVKACSQAEQHAADNRVVTTTCITWIKDDNHKWVRNAHKWEAPLCEVIAHSNCCPDHRG